ncbi:uncharacterized protein heatr4 isoform X1 [Thunnus albacares]|uniref:uncharacterized protein heatr4 isoform X1 n=1 Tax=Thunnus albacares TaxID=8236 RepID=UPI001CF68970|nr:uncharacterized protein heatr4 isoform X1 [Thunnus albacares]XP_044231763.1 uncharacterized protein heatr4 isoform X1 [Thunnus albacares]
MGSPGGPKVCGSASIHMRRSQLLYQRFLTDAAAGLTFSHDIMAELDADSISYSQADFRQLFRPTGVLEPAAKRTTQDRKLSRLPPRPKNPQVLPRLLGFRGLLQSVDRSPPRPQGVQLLQSSSTGNRGTAVTGNNHYVEEASGSGKPVQKVAHQSHDQITSDDSKYHINQQRRSSPAPDTMTTHANKTQTVGTVLAVDQERPSSVVDDPVWRDQIAAADCRPDSRVLNNTVLQDSVSSDADGWMAAQCLALDGDDSRVVIQRILAQLFLCQDQPDSQDHLPGPQDHLPGPQDHLLGSRDQLPDTQNQLPDTQDQLPDTKDQLPDTKDQLPDPQDQLPDPQDQLPDTQDQLPDTKDQLPDTKDQLPDPQDQLPDPQDQLPDPQDQLPDTQDQLPDTQLVVSLLTHFTSETTLVRSLLAEHLNRSEYRTRLLACNTLSGLKWPINKDVVHKLTHLMCNDQSYLVCLAAAETLMTLGKVQDVHNELRLKLEEPRGLQRRIEALDLISRLKITTAKLLEPVVSCLSDEVVTVRKQACVTAASLLLKDEMVVRRLLELVEDDPAQEVRLSAINAVGALGLSAAGVQETLLRCVETEEEAELQLAARQLLHSSQQPSDELQGDDQPSGRRLMKEEEEEHCDTLFSLQMKRQCELRLLTEKVLLLEKLQDQSCPGRRLQRATLALLLTQRYRQTDDAVTPTPTTEKTLLQSKLYFCKHK